MTCRRLWSKNGNTFTTSLLKKTVEEMNRGPVIAVVFALPFTIARQGRGIHLPILLFLDNRQVAGIERELGHNG